MIKCLLIDNEVSTFDALHSYVQDITDFELAGYFNNSHAAAKANAIPKRYDLIIIDAGLAQSSGFALTNFLHEDVRIVFISASNEYAAEAFNIGAVDYLVKPVTYERFLRCVVKIRKAVRFSAVSNPEAGYFYFKCGTKGKLEKLFYEEIIYIEAALNYVLIYTAVPERYITYVTLKDMERELPPALFYRVHKSYIINVAKIKSFESNSILLQGGMNIPLGNSYHERFFKMLNDHTLRGHHH